MKEEGFSSGWMCGAIFSAGHTRVVTTGMPFARAILIAARVMAWSGLCREMALTFCAIRFSTALRTSAESALPSRTMTFALYIFLPYSTISFAMAWWYWCLMS